jgi:hypothetical protein
MARLATSGRPSIRAGKRGNAEIRGGTTDALTLELIDELFGEQITIVENGVSRRVSVFQAILLQLLIKEMAGDRRALAVRLKYQEFVAQQRGPPEIIVERNARTG